MVQDIIYSLFSNAKKKIRKPLTPSNYLGLSLNGLSFIKYCFTKIKQML